MEGPADLAIRIATAGLELDRGDRLDFRRVGRVERRSAKFEVQQAVRSHFARLWDTVAGISRLEPVTVKTFLAFGMLLNAAAAVDAGTIDAGWSEGVRTRINAGLFEHVTTAANR